MSWGGCCGYSSILAMVQNPADICSRDWLPPDQGTRIRLTQQFIERIFGVHLENFTFVDILRNVPRIFERHGIKCNGIVKIHSIRESRLTHTGPPMYDVLHAAAEGNDPVLDALHFRSMVVIVVWHTVL
jgi:hypothetical protein